MRLIEGRVGANLSRPGVELGGKLLCDITPPRPTAR
jgi:hypothetical protein